MVKYLWNIAGYFRRIPQITREYRYIKGHLFVYMINVFQTPERTASLLRVAAKKSPSLKEFIDAVNLNGDAGKNAELLVGLIEEHKSSPDGNVMKQLLTYWYKLMFRKMQNIPTVALIIYNGKHPWNPMLGG